MGTRVGIIYDERYKDHDTGGYHPECPDRMTVIETVLRSSMPGLVWLAPRSAELKDLMRVHTPEYVSAVRHLCERGGGYIDSDTPCSSKSFDVALLAAGAGMTGLDALMEKDVDRGFAVVRPPGHHAFRGLGGGFCLFNNVAICVSYARERWGLKRVAVVDWDVHHGNGTEAILSDDPQSLYISFHQWPHYPGTGGPGEEAPCPGMHQNFPLQRGTPGETYRRLMESEVRPLLDRFRPDLLLGSVGFDSGAMDPLGGLMLEEDDFEGISKELSCAADRLCSGRLLTFLEGGYSLQAVGGYALSHVKGLLVQ